jgi:arylsulfatase A-like enzyme
MRPRRWTVLLAIGLLAPRAAPAADPPARSNVLFVVIDDLNDWIGPLKGHPQVRTPNLDRLAARGVTFTNAHCQSPLCNPSRTSFLTGLRPTTTGVYALEPWIRTVPGYEQVVTLPQYLREHGYRTLTTGKIFHDAYPPPRDRRDGPEVDVWGYHGTHGPRPAKPFVVTPGRNPLVDWGPFPESDEQQEDAKVADWAIGQLKASPREPFWMGVGLRRPHVPCYAPQKWFDLYPAASLMLPPVRPGDRDDTPRFSWYLHWRLPEPRLAWLEAEDEWKPLVRSYLACVSFMDAQVGRVLEALDESGLKGRTVVVFLSDHGWHLGEKDITGKNTLWDRSTRVPLIVAGPGIEKGAVCTRPAELLDLFPTIVELAGLPAKSALEGHSLVPQLRDASAPRVFPAITTHGPGNHGVRSESHRYIRYADGTEELYEYATDPNEWTNRATDPALAAVKADLARRLPARDAPPAPGSKSRLIELRDGVPWWEGQPIVAGEPIPD